MFPDFIRGVGPDGDVQVKAPNFRFRLDDVAPASEVGLRGCIGARNVHLLCMVFDDSLHSVE